MSASVLILAMSAVSGCASQASSPSPTATVEARPLSQKQLESARLAEGEAGRYGVGLGSETPADMEPGETSATPEACLPAIKVLLHGWAKGATAYTRFNLSDSTNTVGVRSVALTSYHAGEAKRVFAAVEKSLQDCPSVVYKPMLGTSVHAKLSLGEPLAPGDESLRAIMSFSMKGIDNHTAYGLVRIGNVLAWFKFNETFGSTLPQQKKAALTPVLPESLVAQQVKKVETIMETTSTP
ncbi:MULTISPECIES: hypothetical protein [Streptomyces]|uniref:hypothetical protein n=1 Tax=Streptomyces TaxID=1883 RepID=UPI00037EF2FF|nr:MULTISPECIES: hypothetical protein [Streptomyces]